jgi:hypothetical protein
MRKATRIVASWFGILAGLAGLEHGYFEILQGNIPPPGLMFPSMGPPCAPEKIWSACEPAMSILPSLLITGILTVLLGLLIIFWSGTFLHRQHGGRVLMVLSVVQLLLGGGFFPPLIGLIGGFAGTQINKPLKEPPGRKLCFTAKLWPWPLVIFSVWVLAQFPVGYFFNDFLKSIMGFGLLLILVSLPLSVYTGYAHDAVQYGIKHSRENKT